MIGTWSTGEEDMVLKTFPSVECSIFLWKHFWAEKIVIVRSVTEIQFIILRTDICHCCLHPSFSFFFLIFLSNDADFFDVELCMGMYGGMGISVSNTDVCRGDTCLWRRKKWLLKGKFVQVGSPINLFAGGKVQDWLLSHRLSISPNVGVPIKAK